MNLRLATGPVSWGVDFGDEPGRPAWQEVLDGVAAAGYEGIELGPLGYLAAGRSALAARGLALTGGFVFEPLHDPGARAAVLAQARRVASRVAELGGGRLIVIDRVSPARSATAGRTGDARRLPPARFDAMLDTIDAVAAVASAAGLQALVHPHAGTYIEFADEIARAAEACPLCVDTGHCAYAGVDPAGLADVAYVHLKDLDPARVRGDFWASVRAGAFVPLGSGSVDFAALLAALEARGFDGWAVVEQDRVAGRGDPVADLVASRRFLEGLASRSVA